MKGGKFAAILKLPYCRTKMFRHRVAAGLGHARVLSGLDCRTVVDIGANRGQFSLVARRCLPQARVISFEPLPAAAAKFRAVFADDDRVMLYEVAICPVPVNASIHILSGRTILLPCSPLPRHKLIFSPEPRKRPQQRLGLYLSFCGK